MPRYHGAGCTSRLERFAMCCRDTSSTSPSSVYEYGTPAFASVSSDSASRPAGVRAASSAAMSRLIVRSSRSGYPTNVHRSDGNFSVTAAGETLSSFEMSPEAKACIASIIAPAGLRAIGTARPRALRPADLNDPLTEPAPTARLLTS